MLGPDFGGGGAPFAVDGDDGFGGIVDGVELLDAAAEEVGERAGAPVGLETVVSVLHACALAEDEVAAVLDVGDEVFGGFVGEDGEAGGYD